MQRMVIKGSEWHRGGKFNNGGEGSRLLTSSGKRCCLGIHGRHCKIPDDRLRGATYPSSLIGVIPKCYRPWVGETYHTAFNINSLMGSQAAVINDNAKTTDKEKIAALRPIFRRIGVIIVWRPDL